MTKAKRYWNLWLPGNKAIEAKKETKPDAEKVRIRREIEDKLDARKIDDNYMDEYS